MIGFIKNCFNSAKKVFKKHAGIILGASVASAAAVGAYLLTLPVSTSATIIYVAATALGISVGSTLFSAGVLIGDSSQDVSQSSCDPIIEARLTALEAASQNTDQRYINLDNRINIASQQTNTYDSKINKIEREQAKLTKTLSETSISFSRLETETKTRFKAQEKVNTDLEDRLTDCEDEIETLSANNDSGDGLEENGFFAHSRRRNVASANEVNFSQASTHRINN